MLIRIFHACLNRSIDIIMDQYYKETHTIQGAFILYIYIYIYIKVWESCLSVQRERERERERENEKYWYKEFEKWGRFCVCLLFLIFGNSQISNQQFVSIQLKVIQNRSFYLFICLFVCRWYVAKSGTVSLFM